MVLYTGWRVEKISLDKKCPSQSVCWYALLASIHWRGYSTGTWSSRSLNMLRNWIAFIKIMAPTVPYFHEFLYPD